MMRYRFGAFLILAAFFATANAKSVNPRHLKEITPVVEYIFESDVVIEGYNITYTLRAGTYFHRYNDRRGRYLLGEGNCLHLEIHSHKVQGSNDWACGIYVPDDTARGASFYRIRPNTDTNSEMGPVVNAIIRYGYGSFDWPDKAESMELRNTLSARVP